MSPYKKGKALTLSLAEILFFTFHSSLAGDMFLTGLGKYLGFNDYHFGILNAIPLLGAASQVLWALLIIFYPSYRRLVLLGSFIARIAWFLSYFLPLYGNGNASHLFIFIGIASLFNSLFTLAWSVWLGEIMPEDYRGRHLSHRTFINQMVWQVLALAGGVVVDRMGIPQGLKFVFNMALIFGLIHTLIFILMPVPHAMRFMEKVSSKILFSEIYASLKTPAMKKFIFFIVFFNFIQGLPSGMWLPFILGDLRISYTTFGWIRVIATGLGLLTMLGWGRVVDRFKSKPVIEITMFITALHPFLYLLATPDFIAPIFVDTVSSMVMWPGFSLAFNALLYAIAPNNIRVKPVFFALYASISSLLLASGSYMGGLISQFILPDRILVLGLSLSSKQQIFFLTGVLRFVALILFSYLIEDPGATKTGRVILYMGDYSIRKIRFLVRRIYSWRNNNNK